MLAQVGAKLRSFWPVQLLKLIILLIIPYRISIDSFPSYPYIHLSSIFWQWYSYESDWLVAQSFGLMSPWTAVANISVIAAPSLYFSYRLRGMSESESSSWLAASTTAVSFICFILISQSYWFTFGSWREDIMYWQALQGFVTILLALFVFVPTLERVSNKRLPKRQIRMAKRVRDRLHQTLMRVTPQHVGKLMILSALVLPYGFVMFVHTYAYGLTLFSPLAGMFSIYFQIYYFDFVLALYPRLHISFFMQLGSATIGFLALGILWLQLLYVHEVLRYLEGRTSKRRVTLIGLAFLVPLIIAGVSSGISMMLGLTGTGFIPFPVSFLIGLWLVQKKNRLLSEGETEPVQQVAYLIHENEVCVPIIYILESRVKKLLGRHES